MSCEGWKRVAQGMALGLLVVAIAACGGAKEDESGEGGSGGAKGSAKAAEAAGPDEATKNAAIRDAEQKHAALRQQSGDLKNRATIDGVAEEDSVQQRLSALERQVSDAQSKIAALKSATGEDWSAAKSGAESALSSAQQAASQAQSEIRAVRDAKRAEAIEALKPHLAKGLVIGLEGEEYEAYKRSVIERTQEELKSRGLYDGPVDGWLEETTKRALAAFQEQAGLPASGVPTPKTRRALFGEGAGDEESEDA